MTDESNNEGDFTCGPIAIPDEKADDKKLGSLHGVVSEFLTLMIASGKAPPALVGAAITFLKNNNITASAARNESLDKLKQTLEGKRKRGGGLTPQAAAEATAAFQAMAGDMVYTQ